MNKELEVLINKALYEDKDAGNKEKENKPVALTGKDKELVYSEEGHEYEQPWQKINNR